VLVLFLFLFFLRFFTLKTAFLKDFFATCGLLFPSFLQKRRIFNFKFKIIKIINFCSKNRTENAKITVFSSKNTIRLTSYFKHDPQKCFIFIKKSEKLQHFFM